MTIIFPSWHFSQWHAVDDRVRGGSSQSHFDHVAVETSNGARGVGRDEKRSGARFWGTLDTKTLGGAGFASRKYQFGPTPLSLPRAEYTGVTLLIQSPAPSLVLDQSMQSKPNAPETFTLVFKTDLNTRPPSKPKVPPSPDPASLSYEAQFNPSHLASSAGSKGNGKELEVYLPFDDFVPTYRGRPVPRSDPRYQPFDPANIYEVSLMCRSDFGKQEGEFELVVMQMKGQKREASKSREGCWGWVRSLWAGGEGGIELADGK